MIISKRKVETRWGVCFWKLIADFADQGLSRSDTARAIGYRVDSFIHMLANNPEHDPFDSAWIAVRYLQDTGETVRAALERMEREGRTWAYACKQIGYYNATTLKRAVAKRGWVINLKTEKGRSSWKAGYSLGPQI